MPWRETKLEDVRLNFIEAVSLHSGCFYEVCDAFGISRKTGYKWIKRFQEGGLSNLADKRRCPRNRPRDTEDDVVTAIINAKLRRPHWGASKLKAILEREHPSISWPSRTTFGNILHRNKLTSKRTIRGRFASAAPISECYAPNDVWTTDFKGWWRTKSSEICEPFTLCDSYSRFILHCQHAKRKNFNFVWGCLKEVFEEYGMPKRIRSDNGPPFASRSVGRLSKLSIKLIRLKITPEWITPGRPQENGIHERMHKTLKLEAATPPANDLLSQQTQLDKFVYSYNWVRPHESLDMLCPREVYSSSTRVWTGEEEDPKYPEGYEERNVDVRGSIKWQGIKVFLSELLYGEKIGLKEMGDRTVEIYFGPILLGRIDPLTGFKKV
jgi:transposase InsO family protein